MASSINTWDEDVVENVLTSIPLSTESSTALSKPLQRLSTLASHISSELEINMSGTDYKFYGWFGKSPDCIKNGQLVKEEFTPKKFSNNDVDVKITHCGICG